MESQVTHGERVNFSKRLKASVVAAGVPLKISEFTHAAWLRFGDQGACEVQNAAIPESLLATEHLALIRDVISLPEPTQKIIRGIVDIFLSADQDKNGA
jgi:hypothetical protein